MAPTRLSLGEAAIIAGLVKAPSNYSPTADVEAARGRAGVVLKTMVENGFVTPARPRPASIRPTIKVQPTTKQNSVRYFTDWALPQLDTLIDETSEPIDVWTTLDPSMQTRRRPRDRRQHARAARRARWSRSTATARSGRWSAAATMSIRIYNRATQAERQPGSAFKLFVYLAALESGMKPTDTIVDEPVTIDGWTPAQLDPHPRSARSRLREAFARSINTVSAKIGDAARLRDHRRHGAPVRDQRPDLDLSRRWCSAPATSA